MSQKITLGLQIQAEPKSGPEREPNTVLMNGLQQVTLDVVDYSPEAFTINMTAAGFNDKENLVQFLEMSLGILKKQPDSHKAFSRD